MEDSLNLRDRNLRFLKMYVLCKVINVDINKKLVTIACYDKQHVCAYLQPFSCYTR